MKSRLLLTIVILLVIINSTNAQDYNPNFKAPQSWTTDECGSLVLLPTFDYNEFINYGGYAYADCGINESSLSNYFSTYYDEFLEKMVIETIYRIEDSCGNTMECIDYYLYHPPVYIPDIISNEQFSNLEDIELITGLPYSDINTQITAEQFMQAGGNLFQNCDGVYPELEYSDWIMSYDENWLPKSLKRTFFVFDPGSWIISHIDQYIDLESPNPVDQRITIIPPINWAGDLCESYYYQNIFDYNDFINRGGMIYSECGIDEGSFQVYMGGYFDEFFDKYITETIYHVRDFCGNVEEYSDFKFIESIIEEPTDIYSTSECFSFETVEQITGLPYSNTFTSITNEQFMAAGGIIKPVCDYSIFSIEYIDNLSSSSCSSSLDRTFFVNGFDFLNDQLVVFEDIEPPILAAPIDTVFNCLSEVPDPFTSLSEFEQAGGIASDNCVLMRHSFQLVNESREGICPQTITRTYEIQDSCGNKATADQVYMIIDENPPTVAFTPDINVECSGDIPPVYNTYEDFIADGGAIADDCSSEVLFGLNNTTTSGSSCSKVIEREYLAMDYCGNVTYFTQTITVVDTMAPVISGIADLNIGALSAVPSPYTYVDFINAGGQLTDNCYVNHSTFHLIKESSTGNCPTTIKRIYEVADSCGNVGSWEQTITINDTIPPIFFDPYPTFAACIDSDSIPIYTSYEEFTNHGGFAIDINGFDTASFSFVNEISEGVCPEEITRTYQISDYCGNTSTCVHRIHIEDYIPPQLESPEDMNFDCLSNVPSTFTSLSEFVAAGGSFSDYCGVIDASFRLQGETVDGSCPTTIRRIYAIDDNCGNTGRCTQTISILDTIPPTFLSQPQTIQDVEFGNEFPPFETLEFKDNCGTPELITSVLPYTENENGYAVTYLWTLTDSCGNATSTSTIFNVLPKPTEYCESYGNAANEWIKSVSIGTETNNSGAEGYMDFTNEFAFNVESGSSYGITLVPDFSSKATFEYWAVWIDFDVDGVFSDDEKVFTADKKRSTVTGIISIPQLEQVETRMRVVLSRDGAPLSCGNVGNGEVEDYLIRISSAEPQPPVAAFSSNKTVINVGETVQFLDQSINNSGSWTWFFNGGEPAASSEQNPVVSYYSTGSYDVFLKVSNEYGTDSVSLSQYIMVNEAPPVNLYCSSNSLTFSKEWISSLILGEINNSSGGSTYSDFTTIRTSLVAGNTYSLQLTPGFSGKSQREFFKVWIDFNQDFDFDDANEEVFTYSNAKSTISGSIQIPTETLPGTTRMRISMKANAFANSCEVFDRGEVEDYSVEIINNKSAQIESGVKNEGSKLLVYPNPANEILNIDYDATINSKLKVFDAHGSLLLEKLMTSDVEKLDIRNFATGLYYLAIENEKDNLRVKFIKK